MTRNPAEINIEHGGVNYSHTDRTIEAILNQGEELVQKLIDKGEAEMIPAATLKTAISLVSNAQRDILLELEQKKVTDKKKDELSGALEKLGRIRTYLFDQQLKILRPDVSEKTE